MINELEQNAYICVTNTYFMNMKEDTPNEKKPVEIKCDITVEIIDDDKPEKPQKPMTIDNGLLPWGSLLLVSMIVMFGSFAWLVSVERSEIAADIFYYSIISTAVLLIPWAIRDDKVMTQNGDYPGTINKYLGRRRRRR